MVDDVLNVLKNQETMANNPAGDKIEWKAISLTHVEFPKGNIKIKIMAVNAKNIEKSNAENDPCNM